MWIRFYKILLALGLIVWGVECSANKLEQQRQIFLQAENSIVTGSTKDFSELGIGLEDYPLYPYLEYQWLSHHLENKTQILDFLHKYKASRYVHKLRRQWMTYLYKHQQWGDFVEYYQSSSNRFKQCRYQWARYKLNYRTKALIATQKIWLTGASLPKTCDPLLAKFTQSSFLTQELVWQRFKLAIKKKQIKLATYLRKILRSTQAKTNAKQWIKLAKNPDLIKRARVLQGVSSAQKTDMLVYAMRKLVSKDVEYALPIWKAKKARYPLSRKQLDKVERSIALQLAFNKSDQAYAQFQRLNKLDSVTRIWAVRAALIEHNWAHVQDALNKLTRTEKHLQRWKYWQARTYMQTGQQEEGMTIFAELAHERSYYGFIAADYLQQDYLLENNPIEIDEGNRKALLATTTFAIINEFRLLGRDQDAQLNWWDALRGASEGTQLAAAKIAQQWNWHRLAILTVAKAKNWDDVALRFPIDYADKIQENAQLQKLDQAIIYGLVRRESMFNEKARSPAGALGLMQVMPGTGRQIAREIKFPWKSSAVLLDATTNIKFGTYYYKQMLDQFGGHFALAAAAYNAGPHRVDKWLKTDRDYAADIWVETIPFKETRAYVSAVLAYALIYQSRLGSGQLLMADLMGDIQRKK